MGAWGVEPYENDDGSNIKEIWEDFLNDKITKWGSKKTLAFFERVYFKGNLPVVNDNNISLVIAIVQKFDDNNLSLPKNLKEALSSSLNLGLTPDALSEWGNSKQKRKKCLVNIAKKHDIKIEVCSAHTKTTGYTQEIKSLKKWFLHLEEINGVRQSMSLKTIDFIDSIKPEFGKMLEKSTWDFYDEQDEDGSAELGNLRYMYVIWFALFNMQYDSKEIISAIENKKL